MCLRDGICVAECPSYLIELKEGDAYPTPVARAETDCIHCGHCVAVCPTGALWQVDLSPVQCEDVRPDLLPGAAQVEQLLRVRRSMRSFTEQPVPQTMLARLLDIAACAPSASNGQPVEWLVIYDSDMVRRLGQMALEWLYQQALSAERPSRYLRTFAVAGEQHLDMICRGAPHLVIAHTPPGAQTDGVIALTYLELAAFGSGLGACWCGFIHGAIAAEPAIRETAGLPMGRAVAGALLIGYPRYSYARVPPRNPARVQWK
jgi:nitroreductase/NAD-dependent dihydropyrimidine dehydrogenase PreA subunit